MIECTQDNEEINECKVYFITVYGLGVGWKANIVDFSPFL